MFVDLFVGMRRHLSKIERGVGWSYKALQGRWQRGGVWGWVGKMVEGPTRETGIEGNRHLEGSIRRTCVQTFRIVFLVGLGEL